MKRLCQGVDLTKFAAVHEGAEMNFPRALVPTGLAHPADRLEVTVPAVPVVIVPNVAPADRAAKQEGAKVFHDPLAF